MKIQWGVEPPSLPLGTPVAVICSHLDIVLLFCILKFYFMFFSFYFAHCIYFLFFLSLAIIHFSLIGGFHQFHQSSPSTRTFSCITLRHKSTRWPTNSKPPANYQ